MQFSCQNKGVLFKITHINKTANHLNQVGCTLIKKVKFYNYRP